MLIPAFYVFFPAFQLCVSVCPMSACGCQVRAFLIRDIVVTFVINIVETYCLHAGLHFLHAHWLIRAQELSTCWSARAPHTCWPMCVQELYTCWPVCVQELYTAGAMPKMRMGRAGPNKSWLSGVGDMLQQHELASVSGGSVVYARAAD